MGGGMDGRGAKKRHGGREKGWREGTILGEY